MNPPARLTRWKTVGIDVAGAVVALAMGAALYGLAIRPADDQRAQVSRQQAQFQVERQEAAAQARHAQDLARQVAAAREALRRSPLSLEPASRLNSRLTKLTDSATTEGLKLEEVHPSEPAYGRDCGSVAIRLRGSGSFIKWITFLRRLSQDFPDMAVDSFQLAGQPDASTAQMDFQVSLVWFVSAQSPALTRK
jgi:Tfp pilus assembly protein PilO